MFYISSSIDRVDREKSKAQFIYTTFKPDPKDPKIPMLKQVIVHNVPNCNRVLLPFGPFLLELGLKLVVRIDMNQP